MALHTLMDGLRFSEAPRWHEGRLWFSDFFRREVIALSPDGTAHVMFQLEEDSPSGLGWRPDGTLLVVSMHEQKLLAWDGASLSTVAELAGHVGGHCNDMVVDAQGRAYVGNFGFDLYAGEAPRTTRLVRVDTDGSVHAVAEGLTFPNGMALTPDGHTLIVAETHANRLTAFDRDPATGDLGARRVWADLPGVFVDGLCLDAQGAIWVANARGHEVLRVAEGGRVLQTVSSGAQRSYACMLGGEDGRTLYVCTAPGIGPDNGALRQGRIGCVRVDVPHAGLP